MSQVFASGGDDPPAWLFRATKRRSKLVLVTFPEADGSHRLDRQLGAGAHGRRLTNTEAIESGTQENRYEIYAKRDSG